MRKQKPQIALRQGTPAQAIPPRETIAVPAEGMPHPNDFIEALSRKSAPAAPSPTAASPLVSARSLSERFGGNLGGLAKKAGMGVFMLIVYLGLMHLAPDAKMMSLIGGKTTGTNTEMNVSTLNAGGVAPEMESKVGSSGETTAGTPSNGPGRRAPCHKRCCAGTCPKSNRPIRTRNNGAGDSGKTAGATSTMARPHRRFARQIRRRALVVHVHGDWPCHHLARNPGAQPSGRAPGQNPGGGPVRAVVAASVG